MKTIITIQHTQSVHHINGMVGWILDGLETDEIRSQACKNQAKSNYSQNPCLTNSHDRLT